MNPAIISEAQLRPLLEFRPAIRSWQARALTLWSAQNSGTVSVVTGGGKTVFAFLCMRELLRVRPDIRCLVIVPTLALLDQWVFAFRREVGLPDDAVRILHSDSGSGDIGPINVSVINSARDLTQRLTSKGEWFLCIDECHRAGSPINALALRGHFVATLGLSATPKRQYDSGFEEHVAPVIGDVIFEYSYADALLDGIVSPFILRNYKIPLTRTEARDYAQISGAIARELSAGGATSPLLERLLRRRASVIIAAKWRVPTAASLALQFNKPTLVFHERIAAAAEITKLIEKHGRRAVSYHSGLSVGMRQRNLALFREGIADTLVTCRSLDEGFNVPEAEIGILAASTRSVRQRVQRLGRVIRRNPGKDSATVCTLYATPVEEEQLRSEVSALGEIAEIEWFDAGLRP